MSSEEHKDLEHSGSNLKNGYAELTETIRELVTVMREGGIGRLDVKRGDLRISLSAEEARNVRASASQVTADTSNTVEDSGPPAANANHYVITSPMIGTYYVAPAPGERPYVLVGDRIEVGQTVAIIEAMKIMNEIVSERAGVVEEILVANGEAVEYGHPLLHVRLEA